MKTNLEKLNSDVFPMILGFLDNNDVKKISKILKLDTKQLIKSVLYSNNLLSFINFINEYSLESLKHVRRLLITSLNEWNLLLTNINNINNLEELVIDFEYFNKDLKLLSSLKTLKNLTISSKCFNMEISLEKTNITCFTLISISYNKKIKLPSTLKYLYLYTPSFSKSFQDLKDKENLIELYLESQYYTGKLDFLPKNLEKTELWLDNYYGVLKELPSTCKCFMLYSSKDIWNMVKISKILNTFVIISKDSSIKFYKEPYSCLSSINYINFEKKLIKNEDEAMELYFNRD